MKRRSLIFILSLCSCLAPAQQTGVNLLRKLGYPPDTKLLIIHADDVGMSHSVNAASFEAMEKGWVTSASIMVPCPWFNEVAEFARSHPKSDLGLHLTLTSEWQNYRWGPVGHSEVNTLLDEQGYFPTDSQIVGKQASAGQAEQEIRAQLQRAALAGIHFSHLDSHMGAMAQNADLMAVYLRVGRDASVPVSISPREIKAYPQVFASYGNLPFATPIGPAAGTDLLEGFRQTLSTLQPGVYITIVHLGHDETELRAIMLDRDQGAQSRQRNFDLVGNPEFHRLLKENRITLISWKDVAKALNPTSTAR